MAKNTNNIKYRKGINKQTKMNKITLLKSNKFKWTIFTLILAFATYLLFALTSYLFTASYDQSKLSISSIELINNSNITVENNGGKTGAILGNILINKSFGISSFLLVYILVIIGFKIINITLVKFWKNIFLSCVGIFWISTTLGLIITNNTFGYHIAGQVGIYMSSWMNAMFGFFGALLILFCILVSILFLAFDNFIPWVIKIKAKIFTETPNIEDENYVNYENNESNIKEDENFDIKVFSDDEENKQNDTSEEIQVDINNINLDLSKQLEIEDNNKLEEYSDDEDQQNFVEYNETEVISDNEIGITIHKKSDEETIDINNIVASLDQEYDPTLDLSNYKFPSIDLLDDHQGEKHDVSEDELIENKNKIVETLAHYKIDIVKIRATIGPTITLYEIIPAPGTRVNKIKNLEDDIALSLAALGVRIIAPIPGKGTIGIEVPNKKPEIVSMRSIVASKKFQECKMELPVVMGKTITNETFVFDLAKTPHLLVAGATGQGKSVGLNAIITSLLYKKHPSQLKMVMVDPKMVELNIYGVIEKHFLAKLPDADKPIITDVDKVKNTLNSLTIEMDDRYKLLMAANARNIKEYNNKFTARQLNPLKGHKYLPYIVMIVDEFADLIMTAGKEIETPIARIAQKARAVGMHMIIATQRPSTNIITGVIKANFPARIAFRVSSMIDSRTILDTPGANQLIGKGDMLIMQGSDLIRLQCAFVDTPEVERICEHIAKQQGYPSAFLLPEYSSDEDGANFDIDMNNRDSLFDEAARMVVTNQMGSTSMIQRKFAIGYNRAGRIMDQLEACGIVGPSEGSKARQVLIHDDYALEQLINSL